LGLGISATLSADTLSLDILCAWAMSLVFSVTDGGMGLAGVRIRQQRKY